MRLVQTRSTADVELFNQKLREQTSDVANSSERANQLLTLVNEVLHTQAEDLNSVFDNAYSQLDNAGKVIKERSDELELIFGIHHSGEHDRSGE